MSDVDVVVDPVDWLARSAHMTTQEVGASWILECCWFHQGQSLPAPGSDELRRLARVKKEEWPKVWEAIAPYMPIAYWESYPVMGEKLF